MGRTSEFAIFLSFKQFDKAMPLLLDVRNEIKAVRKTGDATLEAIRGLREDIQPGFAMQFRQMQVDVRAIKERLGMS